MIGSAAHSHGWVPPAWLLLTLASATPTGAAGQSAPPESTTVILLGTGVPRPDPSASGPATAIVVGRRVLLFDAGAGVMRQVAAAGLPISGPDALFITHLHSDHTLGYPDVILTSWVMRRHRALQVFGPPGLRAMTDHLLAAWAEDIRIRTTGLERERAEDLAVSVHEIGPGVVYDSGGVRVTAIPVQHAAPENRPGGDAWPRYMRASHTSDVELGELAARVRPKLLIFDHLIRMGASDEDLLAGVRAGGFTGRAVIGRDLERY